MPDELLLDTVSVHVFSTGRVRTKRGERGVRRYLPGGWGEETLPVNVFLVTHPAGLCLFDTGQTAAAAAPGYFPRWYPFFRLARFELGPEDEAAAQLRRRGFDPDTLRWVVLSHLHTDHVGGLGSFPGAEVLVSRVEWERAGGLAGRVRGYLPQHWPDDVVPRLVDLDGPAIGPFAASCDLAGDGRLVLLAAPGHTPGQLGLLVGGDAQTYLLGGDLAHTSAELPPEIADFCRRENVVYLGSHDPHALALVGP